MPWPSPSSAIKQEPFACLRGSLGIDLVRAGLIFTRRGHAKSSSRLPRALRLGGAGGRYSRKEISRRSISPETPAGQDFLLHVSPAVSHCRKNGPWRGGGVCPRHGKRIARTGCERDS